MFVERRTPRRDEGFEFVAFERPDPSKPGRKTVRKKGTNFRSEFGRFGGICHLHGLILVDVVPKVRNRAP